MTVIALARTCAQHPVRHIAGCSHEWHRGPVGQEPAYDRNTVHAAQRVEQVLADPTLVGWTRYKIVSSLARVLQAQKTGVHYIFRVSLAADHHREGICTCGLIVSIQGETDEQNLCEARGHVDAEAMPVDSFVVRVRHFGAPPSYSAICQSCGHISPDHSTGDHAQDSLTTHRRDCRTAHANHTEETP